VPVVDAQLAAINVVPPTLKLILPVAFVVPLAPYPAEILADPPVFDVAPAPVAFPATKYNGPARLVPVVVVKPCDTNCINAPVLAVDDPVW
jgi:hypothetical protein